MQAPEAFATAMGWLQVMQQELLLFAAFWFLIGAIDEIAVDLCWVWLRLTGRASAQRISRESIAAPLRGKAAIFIPAWQEAEVIGHTVRHALSAWQYDDFTIYVGCYSNDPETIAAAMSGAGTDERLRIVVHENGIM